jgi:hypothetical protein
MFVSAARMAATCCATRSASLALDFLMGIRLLDAYRKVVTQSA